MGCETSASVGLEKVVRTKSRFGGAVPPDAVHATNTEVLLRNEFILNHKILECFHHLHLFQPTRDIEHRQPNWRRLPLVDLHLNFDRSPTQNCHQTTSSVHVSPLLSICHSLHSYNATWIAIGAIARWDHPLGRTTIT